MMILERLFGGRKKIAFFIDGPNTIRKDVKLDIMGALKQVEKYGQVVIARIYLDQYASDKLIEAMTNQGFEPIITTGDVDVKMAVDATEYSVRKGVEIIALMTRDADFLPVLRKAKKNGKYTIIVGKDYGFSAALKNNADVVILASQNGKYKIIENREIR